MALCTCLVARLCNFVFVKHIYTHGNRAIWCVNHGLDTYILLELKIVFLKRKDDRMRFCQILYTKQTGIACNSGIFYR